VPVLLTERLRKVLIYFLTDRKGEKFDWGKLDAVELVSESSRCPTPPPRLQFFSRCVVDEFKKIHQGINKKYVKATIQPSR